MAAIRTTRLRRAACAAAAATMSAALLAAPATAEGLERRAATSPPVQWLSCADVIDVPLDPAKADCAVYPVPRDYAQPSEGTIDLVMLRRRATDRAHRVGSLFVNPGGPGASGLHQVYRAERFLSADVVARHDVIGFDPRGVGLSSPVRCFRTLEEHNETFEHRLTVPVTADEIAATLRAGSAYSDLCRRNAGSLLPHLSTLNVARDLERMRQGVGDDQISYVGFSYGTLIGATYANLFPSRVRAMVLDANLDPTLHMGDGLEYDRQRARGYEIALGAFLRECSRAGARCPFGGGDVRAKLDQVRTRLRHAPITLPSGQQVTLSGFTSRLAGGLASQTELPALAASLADLYGVLHPQSARPADAGAAGDFAGQTTAAAGETGERPYTGNDAEFGVDCLDKPLPPTATVFPRAATKWEREFPTFGRMQAFDSVPCATWPARWWQSERYPGPWNRPTAHPVLVVGNYYDPVTQYEFSRRMAEQLGRGRLLSVAMIGHTALGLNICADEITARYLLNGELPRPDVVCTPDSSPFGVTTEPSVRPSGTP